MDIKKAILKKGILIKIGVIVLATIILLLAGLGSLSLYKVIVCDLPLFEECPENQHQDGEYVPGQIIVKFKPGTTLETENQLNQSLGTTVISVSPSGGFKVLEIPQGKTVLEMVDIYNQQSNVEYAEPNYIEHEIGDSGS